MFTGIIEEKGRIRQMTPTDIGMRLVVEGNIVLDGAKRGDSIAVNGVCLTVMDDTETTFTADVIPETMKATTLGSLEVGSEVNLERAMAAGDRFGGHIVSGHVDTVGTIVATRRHGNARYVQIEVDEPFRPYFITKGSVAVDGISLTVFGVTETGLIISLIPTTESDTTIGSKTVGDRVNIECDLFAKYIEQLVRAKEETATVTLDELIGSTEGEQ